VPGDAHTGLVGTGSAAMVEFGPAPKEEDAEVVIVDKLPKQKCGTMVGRSGPVLAVRFNRNGQYALTCGKDRTLRLWNPYKGLCIKTYESHGFEVRDCDVTGDNAKLVSVGVDKQIFYWDVATGRTIKRFQGHDFPMNCCKFAAEDQLIVTGSDDRFVKIWDTKSKNYQAVQSMQPFKDTVMSVSVSPTRPEICGGSVDGTVRIFDVRQGTLTTDSVGAPVVCVRFSEDGALILVACADSAVRCLDRRTGEVLGVFTGHVSKGTKTDGAWLPLDAHLCAGGEDGQVTFWDVMGGPPLLRFRAHDLAVTSLDVRADGKAMCTAGADGKAVVWSLDGTPP